MSNFWVTLFLHSLLERSSEIVLNVSRISSVKLCSDLRNFKPPLLLFALSTASVPLVTVSVILVCCKHEVSTTPYANPCGALAAACPYEGGGLVKVCKSKNI